MSFVKSFLKKDAPPRPEIRPSMPRATPPDARRGRRAKSPPGAPVCAAGPRRAARRKERETFRLILRAKYAIITWKISRCVGMADEGDSKSAAPNTPGFQILLEMKPIYKF